MRGGDHDARVRFIVTRGKGQRGNGHQRIVQTDFDAVCGKNTSGFFSEDVGIDTAVIGHGDELIAALGLDPVGKTLSRLTNYVDIHTVRAGAENAAKARRTKRQGNRESIFDLIFFAFDFFKFSRQRRVFQIRREPTLILFHVHSASPYLFRVHQAHDTRADHKITISYFP